MGKGYTFVCKHCKDSYDARVGMGFLYPVVYKELSDSIRSGKYGEEWKNLIDSKENIAINGSKDVFICPLCNAWKSDYNLSLYEPDNDAELCDCPSPALLDEDYKLIKEYTHKCYKCQGDMVRIKEEDIFELPCPTCGTINEYKEYFLFD